MKNYKSIAKEYLLITAGVMIVAVGIYFFKFPNNFTTGGVSGISILLSALFPQLSAAKYIAVINIALLFVGLAFLGKSFTIKTVYGSLLLSALLNFFEYLFPLSAPVTSQPVLELAFSVLLPAFGSAILFNVKASTGGTDIVAMILRKYSPLHIGKALLCTDAVITVLAFVVFGPETGLFSILGLLSKALIVDAAIENFNLSKYFIIVTEKGEEISEYIKTNLHRGATMWCGKGVFTGNEKKIILAAMNRYQALELRKYIRTVDSKAFIVVANTSDIIGRGFREAV